MASLRNRLLDQVATSSMISGEHVSREVFSFSKLLGNFVHLELSEEEAALHWGNILDTWRMMREKMGREVSLHTAIADYFTGSIQLLETPLLVDMPVFKQTIQIAMVDGLTGLFNRRYMDVVLKKEFNRCERYAKPFSVCIIDIDNFKQINDTLGHPFGDRVLRELALLIKDSVREEDVVCRYGGEEFLLVLPETEEAGAFRLANRIRNALKANRFFREQKISFSAGTATYPTAAREIDELVKAADRALYQAKYSGKDRVISAQPERRRFGRFSENWQLTIFAHSNGEPLSGIKTQNVSMGGVQFECAANYTVDTCLDMVFSDADSASAEVRTTGHITWVKKKQRNYIYGVSFSDTPEMLSLRLGELEKTTQEA